MPNQFDLTADEKRILDYLNKEIIEYENFIWIALSMDDQIVTSSIDVLEGLGLIERDPDQDKVKITGKGRLYAQGRDYMQISSQINQMTVIGSTINNSNLSQINENTANMEVKNFLEPFYQALTERNDLNEYLREDLRRKLIDLGDAAKRGDKKEFEQVKSVILSLAPFMLRIFQSPVAQGFASKLFGI